MATLSVGLGGWPAVPVKPGNKQKRRGYMKSSKSAHMRRALVLAAGLLAALPATHDAGASATLFSDNFGSCTAGSCSVVGSGWSEIEEKAPSSYVEILRLGTKTSNYNWVLDLTGLMTGTNAVTNPDAAATHTFDALGYSDVRLSFQYQRANTYSTAADLLHVSYNPGSGWIDLPTTYALTAATLTSVTDLSLASAANTNGVSLRFWTDINSGGSGGRGAHIDNVQVTGMVPEPETYAMMVAGLALMGFIARRRS